MITYYARSPVAPSLFSRVSAGLCRLFGISPSACAVAGRMWRRGPGAGPSPAAATRAALRAETDAAVGVEGPAGVVRHFPRMPVGIDEDRRVSAPEGHGGLAADHCAGRPCLVDHQVDRLGGPDVVGQGHATPAAAIADSAILGEPSPVPQGDHHAASLEEHDIVGYLAGRLPAHGLVERPGLAEIGHPQRDETDALLHVLASCPLAPGRRRGNSSDRRDVHSPVSLAQPVARSIVWPGVTTSVSG